MIGLNIICQLYLKTGFVTQLANLIIFRPDIRLVSHHRLEKERLFLKDSGVGYIASQKIIHALQYFAYAAENASRVEAETHVRDYAAGRISQEDLKNWIDKEYPGKWNHFISLLESTD